MTFGPKVIGDEAFEQVRDEIENPGPKFGPRVLGEKEETATAVAEPEPEGESDEWPAGYEYKRSGAYYEVRTPGGELIESDLPSGKWQGADAAREAAWQHAAAQEAPEDEAPAGPGTDERDPMEATVEEVEGALAENPSLVDEFMRAELQRPDGVREAVLDAMELAEQTREEPRPEVLETLASLRPDQ